MTKLLEDFTEDELRKRLRTMYETTSYTSSPNDVRRELDRRAADRERRETLRIARIALAVSVIGTLLSFVAIASSLLL